MSRKVSRNNLVPYYRRVRNKHLCALCICGNVLLVIITHNMIDQTADDIDDIRIT